MKYEKILCGTLVRNRGACCIYYCFNSAIIEITTATISKICLKIHFNNIFKKRKSFDVNALIFNFNFSNLERLVLSPTVLICNHPFKVIIPRYSSESKKTNEVYIHKEITMSQEERKYFRTILILLGFIVGLLLRTVFS